MKNVVLFLADGTEECEALITVDILRRAGIKVTTASVMRRRAIKSSSGIKIDADQKAKDINFNKVDMIVLPGGMPGTKYLEKSKIVRGTVLAFNEAGKRIAAICAAPSVLGELGVLEGKNAICYPGFEKQLKGANISDIDPVTDGKITTASGLGHAIDFALELVRVLKNKKSADKVAKDIGYSRN